MSQAEGGLLVTRGWLAIPTASSLYRVKVYQRPQSQKVVRRAGMVRQKLTIVPDHWRSAAPNSLTVSSEAGALAARL